MISPAVSRLLRTSNERSVILLNMKKIPLKDDKVAYQIIISFDCLAVVVSAALAFFVEPIFLLLSLPFAYDLYYVYSYKKRTWVSYISELFTLIP